MTAPFAGITRQAITTPFTGAALPDFSRVRRYGRALSGLLAIKLEDKRYPQAQNAVILARALFDQELGRLQTEINEINAAEQQQASQQPDLGPVAAGRLAASQALSFGLAKPIAKAIPGGASPEDIEAQSQILQQQHGTASTVGIVAGLAAGGLATMWTLRALNTVAKIGQARTSTQASKELIELRKVERALKEEKLARMKQGLPVKPGPMGTTTRSAVDVESLETPTFLRRGLPEPPSRVQTTPEGAQVIPVAAKAVKLTAEQRARAKFFMRQGFSQADAEEMARQGVKASKRELEKLLGKRLGGAATWQ